MKNGKTFFSADEEGRQPKTIDVLSKRTDEEV